MSETTEETTGSDDTGSDADNYAGPPVDAFLLGFCLLVEEDDRNTISVTVTSNGQTFSGQLVGRKTWFARLTASISDSGAADLITGMAQGFEERRAEEEGLSLNFLHLTDCRLLDGRGLAALDDDGGFWRVRVAAVDAWRLGATA